MRKLMVAGIAVLMVLFISACSSEEEDEVLDFHNDMVDTIKPIYEEIGVVGEQIMTISDDEFYDVVEQELIPKIEETEEFFDGYEPETEPAIEYYNMRKAANDDFATYTYEARDIGKEYNEGNLTDEEFSNQLIDLTEYMDQFIDKSEEAEAKWEEISDEYGFEELDE